MCEGYRFLPIPLAMSVCLPASPYVSVPRLCLSFLTSPLWACEGTMWWCKQVGSGKALG